MRNPNPFLLAALLPFIATPAFACDPIITSTKEVLARRDLSFVVGRYAADGTFLVEEVIGGSATRRTYDVLERGPFGNQCEIRVLKVSSPSRRHIAAGTRFLLPIEKIDDQKHRLIIVMVLCSRRPGGRLQAIRAQGKASPGHKHPREMR